MKFLLLCCLSLSAFASSDKKLDLSNSLTGAELQGKVQTSSDNETAMRSYHEDQMLKLNSQLDLSSSLLGAKLQGMVGAKTPETTITRSDDRSFSPDLVTPMFLFGP